MVLQTRPTSVVCFAAAFLAAVLVFSLPASSGQLARKVQRLSRENDAKLIESVAAHLTGMAQLQRVSAEGLDWKSSSNRDAKMVRAAVRNFKSSQVFLSEALSNTAHLAKQLEGSKRERVERELRSLRERTNHLSAKNTELIRALETRRIPPVESLQEITRRMTEIVGNDGIEVAQQRARRRARDTFEL